MDNRTDVRDFLATRRAKISPADVGLPTTERRRVAGLRREEVAMLAGVSTERYTRLEKGHIAGVSTVNRTLPLTVKEASYRMVVGQDPSMTRESRVRFAGVRGL